MTNHQHNSTTNGSTNRLELLQRGKIPIVQPHQLLSILHAHPTPIHEWSHALMDQIEKHPRYDDLLQYLVCWLDDHSSILTCTPSPSPHQQQTQTQQQQAPISSSSSLQSTPPQEQQNEQLSDQQQSVQSNTPSVNNHSTPTTVLLVKSENENNHTNIEEHTATTTTTTLATTVTPTTEQQEQQQQPQSQDEQQEKHHMDAVVEPFKSSVHPDSTPVPISTTDAAAAETHTLTTTPQTITIDATTTTTTPTTTTIGSVEQVMRELGRKLNSHRSLRMTIRSCIRETLNPNSTATQEAEEANQMTVSEYLRSDVKQMLHVLQMKMEDEMREKIQYKTLAKQLLEKQFAELAGEDRINSVGTGGEPSSSSSTPTTNITTEERVQQEPVKQEPNASVMNQGPDDHQQIASAVASTPLSTNTMITNVYHHHQQQQVVTPQQTIPEIMDKVDEVIPADQRQALFRSIFDKVNPDYSRSPKLAPPALSMLESSSLLCSEQPHDILPSTPLHVVYPVHTTQSALLASIPSVASPLLSTSSIESMTSSLPTTVTPLQVLIGTNSTTDKSLLASPITPSSNNTYGSDDEDMDGKHISRKSDGTRRKPPKRITTEKLVAFGLIMPGDKIQFRTPKKTIDSVITADGQVIWMNPKTNKPEQFNYLSRWNNRIDLVVEPSVNRPQHNGWDKTFLILDESQRHRSNGQPEINFREIRDKALVMVSQESKSCSTPTGANRKNKRSAASSSTTARRRRKTPNKSPATTPSPNSNRAMIDDEETEPSSDENESELLLEDEIIIPPPTTPTTPAEGRQKRKRKPSELVSDNAEFERFRKQASRN